MCHFFFLSMSYSPYVLSLVSGYNSKIPCKYLSIYCLPEKLCLNIPISCFILAYVLCLAYYNVFSIHYLFLFSLLIVNFSQFNLPLSVSSNLLSLPCLLSIRCTFYTFLQMLLYFYVQMLATSTYLSTIF